MNNEEEIDILPIEIKIATIEVMLYSLRNSIEDICKALAPKSKITSYEKWLEECENSAKKILINQKEKELEENDRS